ncbi:hypothetical protein [Poriferisphaera sp. WC338]|uniref:hypothetical protein n=1 Tax=Poriferisphaera sp. WC338 TaxID=3425129 RepID=UPI003D812BE8
MKFEKILSVWFCYGKGASYLTLCLLGVLGFYSLVLGEVEEPDDKGPGSGDGSDCAKCIVKDLEFDEESPGSITFESLTINYDSNGEIQQRRTYNYTGEQLKYVACNKWKGKGNLSRLREDKTSNGLETIIDDDHEVSANVYYLGDAWGGGFGTVSGGYSGEMPKLEVYDTETSDGTDFKRVMFTSSGSVTTDVTYDDVDGSVPETSADATYEHEGEDAQGNKTSYVKYEVTISGGGKPVDEEGDEGGEGEAEGGDSGKGGSQASSSTGGASSGCVSCTNASPSFGKTGLGSLHITWGLGKNNAGDPLGHLELHAEEWSADIANKSSLRLYGNGNWDKSVTGGTIVNSSQNGRLAVADYDPDSDGTIDGFVLTGEKTEEIEVVVDPAFPDWTIPMNVDVKYMTSQVTSPATNQILVTQTKYESDGTGGANAVSTTSILYTYSEDGTKKIWEMKNGVDPTTLVLQDGGSHIRQEAWEEIVGSITYSVKRYIAYDLNGGVLGVEEIRFQDFAPASWQAGGDHDWKAMEWEWGTAMNADGTPGGDVKRRQWTRYDDASDFWTYGEVKAVVDENGYWEHFTYGPRNVVATALYSNGTKYYDDPASIDPISAASFATAKHTTEYDYDLHRGTLLNQTDGIYAYRAARIKKTQIETAGGIERTKYTIYWPYARLDKDFDGDGQVDTVVENQLDYKEKWKIECTSNPNANGVTDEAYLRQLVSDVDSASSISDRVARIYRYKPSVNIAGVGVGGKLKQRIGWDGEVIDYSYPDGNTTVVESGYSGARRRVSTREDSSRRVTGRLTSEQDQGGSWFDVNLVTTDYSQDRFNRPTSNNYYYGSEATNEWASEGSGTPTYSTSSSYGCCGIESQTGADGITTSYTYDDFYRYEHVEAGTGVQTKYTYDELGRVIKTERVSSDDSDTVVLEETFFNLSNQIAKTKDGRGICSFYTYRRIGPDGTTFNSATHDRMYRENRVYPHDSTSGPVQVTWKDSRGNVVRQWTGSSSSSWSEASPPVGDELLTELSRSVVSLDWADRAIETKFYHNLTGLTGIDDLGSLNTNYYVGTLDYDHWGRAWKQIDQSGNITISKFDDETGNLIETWVGTDATGATSNDPVGSGSNNMLVVSKVYYDTNYDGTGNRRAYPTKTITLGTTTNINSSSAHAVINEQFWDSVNDERVIWQKPAQDLWQKQVADLRGRTKRVESYSDDGSTLISKQTNVYDDSSTGYGRLIEVKQHEVISGVAGNYIASKYAYEDVEDGGRQIKADEPGGPITKQQFDLHGRLLRTVQISDEVGSDPTNFNDDIVLSEMVYEYDDNDNIIMTTTYSRLETVSDSQAGLLSDNPTSARVTYNATWYDDANRPTHVVDYGTNVPQ